MTNENVPSQEPVWPTPDEQQVLQRLTQSSREHFRGTKRRPGALPGSVGITGAWPSCSAIARGWKVHLEVWRMGGTEGIGSVAPVQGTDQAMSKPHGTGRNVAVWAL